jgi:hypothetical protein
MHSKPRRPSLRPKGVETRVSETRMRAAQRAPESGQHPLRYTLVREVLRRYLSPILVSSVLDKAMAARNVTPAILSPAALAEITSDIMIGLRLFVPEDRLPQLMLELAEVLEGDHK